MGNTKLMNARAEQLRVNPDEQRLQNRRNSCAHEEVCSMQVIKCRKLLQRSASLEMHDLLQPHVTRVLVCDPRKNALLKVGNKNDRIDARKLSELLYLNKLSSVYHGEPGIRALKELARSYIAMTRDLTRVMSRLKAIYRSWAIPCAGQQVYAPRYRVEWLAKISEASVRRRAELYYQQFDALAALRQQARRELFVEARKHLAMRDYCGRFPRSAPSAPLC